MRPIVTAPPYRAIVSGTPLRFPHAILTFALPVLSCHLLPMADAHHKRRRKRLEPKEVVGLPQLRFVEHLVANLRAAYDHPNRKLFLDDLLIAMLLAFFNPVARSLRGVEDASQMPGVNKHLYIESLKRSTTSDALKLFDPDLLLPLIHDLRQRITPRQADAADDTLRGLMNRLIAYDGSYFRTTSDVAWALCERHGTKLRSRVRLNLHLSVRDGLPTGGTGVSVAGVGDPPETQAILNGLQAGQIVVADRGCFSHDTVAALLKGRVDFVLRLQSVVRCDVIHERVLTQADRDAGVISDQTVLLAGYRNRHAPTPMRLVTIQPQGDSTRGEHEARDGTNKRAAGDGGEAREARDASDDASEARDASAVAPVTSVASPLRLLTSVQDDSVPAWMIGQLYRRRWDIELFFRWLKTCAKWEHLISESRNGMLMQFYVALIGTLLLAVATGRKPDRYSINLLSMAAAGMGTVEDALAILERRHAERDRDQRRRQERAASKKS